MRENTKMIKSMVMVFILGQIKDSTKVLGLGESSTVLELIQLLVMKRSAVFGKTEKE